MTRALVTQMLEAMEEAQKYAHNVGKYLHGVPQAITAAREYLATEPSGERAELIAELRERHGKRFVVSPSMFSRAADMLEADADLRTQLARRTVERDMAISMIGDCIDEQQPKRVPMTDMEIYTALASTVENPEPAEELIGCEEWSEIVDMIRRIESHHKINAPKQPCIAWRFNKYSERVQ